LQIGEVIFLVKCKFCGEEIPEQAKITEDGKCSVCGEKVKPA
jgi:DNA-directed RNA polymerase subunit RPC12/RpoP